MEEPKRSRSSNNESHKTPRVLATTIDCAIAIALGSWLGPMLFALRVVDQFAPYSTINLYFGTWAVSFFYLLTSTPVLIAMSPWSPGRKLMGLSVRDANGKRVSALRIMVRETVKLLWLIPIIWIFHGHMLHNRNFLHFVLDLSRSFLWFPIFLVFPVAFFYWLIRKNVNPIHEWITGTRIVKAEETHRRLSAAILIPLSGYYGCNYIILTVLSTIPPWISDWHYPYPVGEIPPSAYIPTNEYAWGMAIYTCIAVPLSLLIYFVMGRRYPVQ